MPRTPPEPPGVETAGRKSRTVSWYPPHMHRAQQRLSQELPHIDVVLEIRDARLPLASGNSELGALIAGRRRLIIFNKSELAHPGETARWRAYYERQGLRVLFLDAERGRGINLIYPEVARLVEASIEKLRRRGIRPPPQRLMVAGIPNVGKSTLINRMARGKKRETAPTPGVTRNVSWVSLKGRYLLMDTPGLLLPRLEDTEETLKLGWIAAYREAVFGEERLAAALAEFLRQRASESLASHYRLLPETAADGEALLEAIGRRRGMLRQRGAVDLNKAARALLIDFRAGRFGRITLETAPA